MSPMEPPRGVPVSKPPRPGDFPGFQRPRLCLSRSRPGARGRPGGSEAGARPRRPGPAARAAPAGAALIDNGLVFTTRHGTLIEPRNFNRSFDRCITAARVPRITVHGTRKTCASLLAALDVHPRVAMRILRHSKINVTMEIYTEAPSDATRDALRRLGDLLG